MKWILLVDDEPHVTRLMRSRLESSGYRVEVAGDGEAALEKLSSRPFDAVITDLSMPRLDGQQLCDIVRKGQQHGEPYLIVATSRADEELHEWAQQVPRLSFMEKPVSLLRLVEELRRVLDDEDGGEPTP